MRNMIAAPEPQAVEEGAKVFLRGGNAVDAAVTCALVQGIVNPQACGLGGFLYANLYLADRPAPVTHSVGLDAPGLAGSQVTPDMWQDIALGAGPDGWLFSVKGQVNDVGYGAICTPGTVKGLAALLERWGTISWADALAPAIAIADEGFVVGEALANSWKTKTTFLGAVAGIDYIRANPEASRIYLRADGSPYDAGDTIRNPDYANTLRRLAAHGPEDFYQGDLAQRISADLHANGSYVTAQDLAEYELREDPVIAIDYRGYTVVSAPPPHCGLVVLQCLNILEGYDLAAMAHNSPDYIYLLSMAMKAASADRNRYLADPHFADVPVGQLLAKSHAAAWRRRIDAGEPVSVSRASVGGPHTTHISAVDRHGNCVALTHSLGQSSGVITPGLGFMYNNSMAIFYPWPGHPNSIAPRKGRTTGMTPAIVYKDGQPVLVIGAPGGSNIATSVVQVIVNILDFGMTPLEAVHAPRFTCQGDTINCHARIPEMVCAEVRKKHAINRLPFSHGKLALVHAITIDRQTGRLAGGADTGGGGMALEV